MNREETIFGGVVLAALIAYYAGVGCLKGGSVQQQPDGTVDTCLDWARKNPTTACDAACAPSFGPDAGGGK